MTFGEVDVFGNALPPLKAIAQISQREGVAIIKTVTGEEFVGPIEIEGDWIVVLPDVETLIVQRSAVVSIEWQMIKET